MSSSAPLVSDHIGKFLSLGAYILALLPKLVIAIFPIVVIWPVFPTSIVILRFPVDLTVLHALDVVLGYEVFDFFLGHVQLHLMEVV